METLRGKLNAERSQPFEARAFGVELPAQRFHALTQALALEFEVFQVLFQARAFLHGLVAGRLRGMQVKLLGGGFGVHLAELFDDLLLLAFHRLGATQGFLFHPHRVFQAVVDPAQFREGPEHGVSVLGEARLGGAPFLHAFEVRGGEFFVLLGFDLKPLGEGRDLDFQLGQFPGDGLATGVEFRRLFLGAQAARGQPVGFAFQELPPALAFRDLVLEAVGAAGGFLQPLLLFQEFQPVFLQIGAELVGSRARRRQIPVGLLEPRLGLGELHGQDVPRRHEAVALEFAPLGAQRLKSLGPRGLGA